MNQTGAIFWSVLVAVLLAASEFFQESYHGVTKSHESFVSMIVLSRIASLVILGVLYHDTPVYAIASERLSSMGTLVNTVFIGASGVGVLWAIHNLSLQGSPGALFPIKLASQAIITVLVDVLVNGAIVTSVDIISISLVILGATLKLRSPK